MSWEIREDNIKTYLKPCLGTWNGFELFLLGVHRGEGSFKHGNGLFRFHQRMEIS
jgi:hypothetical protein